MIYSLSKKGIKNFAEVARDGMVKHYGDLCFSIRLNKGTYCIRQYVDGTLNEVIPHEFPIVIYSEENPSFEPIYWYDFLEHEIILDEDRKWKEGNYIVCSGNKNTTCAKIVSFCEKKTIIIAEGSSSSGYEWDSSLSSEFSDSSESGESSSESAMSVITRTETLKVPLNSDTFNDKFVGENHKLNSFSKNDFCDRNKDSQILDEWTEIPLRLNDAIYVSSNDVSDFRYSIYNTLEDNDSYAMFDRVSEHYVDYDSTKRTVSINFSFPQKQNLSFLMIDLCCDDQAGSDGKNFMYLEFSFSLYGSDTNSDWKLIDNAYPNMKKTVPNNNRIREEQHSLYLVNNEHVSASFEIKNPLNPRLLLDFNNTDNYKCYRLDISTPFINSRRYNYAKTTDFKIRRIKCFSYEHENAPVARFPLQEDTNEINGWVNHTDFNVDFIELQGGWCAKFNRLLNSHIELPRLFFAQNIDEFTISFFMMVDYNADTGTSILFDRSGSDGFYIQMTAENDNVTIESLFNIGENKVTVSATFTRNEFFDVWNHIAITFDKEKLNLYVNGEVRDEVYVYGDCRFCHLIKQNNQEDEYFDLSNMYIARNEFGVLGEYFNGYMKEITFYKKALIKNQIHQIYLKGNMT